MASSIEAAFSSSNAVPLDLGESNEKMSGLGTGHTPEQLPESVLWLWRVCPPVLFVLGTFGNVMTIVVLRGLRVKRSGASMYVLMTSLSVSDSILLYVGLGRRYLRHGYDIEVLILNEFVCKSQRFVIYTCGVISSFILAALSIQRCLSVLFPNRASLLFDQKKSVTAVVAISFFSGLMNCALPFVFGIVDIPESGHKECHYVSERAEHYFDHVHNWIDLSFTSLIPGCILIVANAVTIWKVVKSSRSLLKFCTCHTQNGTNPQRKRISSVTLTLVTLSVVFLLLTLPMCVFIVYSYTVSGKAEYGDKASSARQTAQAVCYLLYFTNSAVNFYLYCLSGRTFRQQLRRVLRLSASKK